PSTNTPPPAPTPAPAAYDELLSEMKEVRHEIRNLRAASPPPAPANDGVRVAMIQAMIQANVQIMQTILTVDAQRAPEVEQTLLAIELIGAVRKLVPAPVAQLAELISLSKALRELTQPTAPTKEFQPLVDFFGKVIAANPARTEVEPRAQ